jgi:hypothetical protein
MLCSLQYFKLWVAANFFDARPMAWLISWHACAFFTFVYVFSEPQPPLILISLMITPITVLELATIPLACKIVLALAMASCFTYSLACAILIGYCVKLCT